jgi:hypothetical protein
MRLMGRKIRYLLKYSKDSNLYRYHHKNLKTDSCDVCYCNGCVYTLWWICFFSGEIQTFCFSCRRLLRLFQKVFSYKLSDTVWWPGHCGVISVRLGRWICVPSILRLIQFVHFRASRRCLLTLTASHIACDGWDLPYPAYVSPFLYMSLSFYLLDCSTPDPHRCVFGRFDTSRSRWLCRWHNLNFNKIYIG